MSKSKLLAILLPALLVIAVAVFFALQGNASGGGAPASSPTPLVGDAAAGQGVYAQKCVTCHGPEGTGARSRALNPAGASLRGADTAAFNQNLVQIITHGKGRMPAWGDTGRLTDQQIADIAAYIISLNK